MVLSESAVREIIIATQEIELKFMETLEVKKIDTFKGISATVFRGSGLGNSKILLYKLEINYDGSVEFEAQLKSVGRILEILKKKLSSIVLFPEAKV